MHCRNILLIVFVIMACTGCGANHTGESATAVVPIFITATLPPTNAPLATQAALPPTFIPTHTPIEGTTNTQLNVRAGTSTASVSLGMVDAFETVQVIGKDASGTWYQIIFAGSATGNGWVRADYVQVNDSGKILPVETGSGFGLGRSAVVLEAINIRNGPGADFDSLGVLSQKDVVTVSGKDSSGAWAQVQVSGTDHLEGWVSTKYLQLENINDVPVIDQAATATPQEVETISTPIAFASPDNDSLQTPLTTVRFSPNGSRALKVQGDVSAPDGDAEDWVQFTTSGNSVVIQTECTSDTLSVELWNNGSPVNGFLGKCGGLKSLTVVPYSDYFLRIFETATNGSRYTHYILNVETNQSQ